MKFKIYDNEKKEWFKEIYDPNNKHQVEILMRQSGELCLRTVEKGMEITIPIDTYPEQTRYTKLYYTGIKDDDGKKVYQGDIVENDVARWEVVIDRGCFCGKLIGGPPTETHIALRAIKGIHIIGNIKDDEQLLKGVANV